MDRRRELIDDQAEKAVIGAAFHDARAWFDHGYELSPNEFADRGRGEIQEVLQHHVASKRPLELPAVSATLSDRGRQGLIARAAECADEADEIGIGRHLAFYARRLRELAHLRRLHALMPQLQMLIADPELDYEEVTDQIGADVFRGLEVEGAKSLGTTAALADAAIETYETRQEALERGESTRKIRTGLRTIDEATGGLQPGHLVVVGARSSHGKTTITQDLAMKAAEDGHPVLIVALEQPRVDVFLQLVQKCSGIRPIEAREGLADRERLKSALGELRALPMVIESGRFNLQSLGALIRRARVVHDIEVVVVDYVQLVSNTLRGQSRATEIAGITAELKRLALDLDICVVAPAQLNKQPDEREGGIPHLSDLRESEAIAHDADQVIFLVRPDLQGRSGSPFLTLAKNRHGPVIDRVVMHYDAQRNRYVSPHLQLEVA